MDGNESKTQAPAKAGARLSWRGRLGDLQARVPTLAVVMVVVTALLATLMVTRFERAPDGRESGVALAPRANEMGAGPACRHCGVVESVAAGNQPGGYRIRVRMDDGTVRTVEHRSALAAGSRVVLEGGSVRVLPAATRQG